MNERQRQTPQGRGFQARTVHKLFSPIICSLLVKLHLQIPDLINEVGNELRLYHLEKGALLPTMKDGMWFVLKGRLRSKTHWKLRGGVTEDIQMYLDYLHKQQGRLIGDYGRSNTIKKSDEARKQMQAGKQVMAALSKKIFSTQFKSAFM